MNKLRILIFTFSVLCSLKCVKKNSSNVLSGNHRGVVLRSICCQDVILSLDGDTLGQDTWIDSGQTPNVIYHNVFKVSNPCQFTAHDGDTISFKVLSLTPVQTCACCMLFTYTPREAYPVQIVR